MSIGNIANTGMKASMSEMEIISNNISNANTIGFKKSYANFVDVYPSGSASNAEAGLGVSLKSVQQNFATGGVEMTGANLDLMVNSNGFFILKDPSSGQISYTRAGHYSLDNNGYITNGSQRLQGFPAANGVVLAGSSNVDLQIKNTPMAASPTTQVTNAINLNSNAVAPTIAFNPNDTTTYNFRTDSQIFDSLGNTNKLSMFYVKTADNNWDVNVEVNGTSVGSGTVAFTTGGVISNVSGLDDLNFNPTSGASSPQNFSVVLSGSTQVASDYNPGNPSANGYQSGTLFNYSVDNNGMVNLYYTNGQIQTVGQLAIANFTAPQGLSSIGNMSWIQTSQSGAPVVSQTNSVGNIIAGSLELSNVDLTDEMVNLIGAQHNFQANAQVEQVYNEVMQTVIKI